jgi:hypothetical protein
MRLTPAERRVLARLYLEAVRKLAAQLVAHGVAPEIAAERAPHLLALGQMRRMGVVR